MKRAPTAVTLLLTVAACSGGDAAPPAEGDGPATARAAYTPTAAERDEVVATLQTLFDALERGDASLLRSVLSPDVVMTFSETTADGATTFGSSTVDGLATRIESSEVPLIERMWDPVVHVTGPLATIWTPYDFYRGETFSHCGVDAATLLRTDDGWRIDALSWTRMQPPACDLHPDGPPAS